MTSFDIEPDVKIEDFEALTDEEEDAMVDQLYEQYLALRGLTDDREDKLIYVEMT